MGYVFRTSLAILASHVHFKPEIIEICGRQYFSVPGTKKRLVIDDSGCSFLRDFHKTGRLSIDVRADGAKQLRQAAGIGYALGIHSPGPSFSF